MMAERTTARTDQRRSPDRRELTHGMVTMLPRLRLLARKLTHNAVDAADLLQDTYVRALENQEKFVTGSPDDLGGWLVTIMRHLQFDRSRKRRVEVPRDNLDTFPAAADRVRWPRWRLVADEPLEAAVGSLPDGLRAVYVLFANDAASYTTIAERLNIPQSTVGTRIKRARTRIRRALERRLDAEAPAAPLRRVS